MRFVVLVAVLLFANVAQACDHSLSAFGFVPATQLAFAQGKAEASAKVESAPAAVPAQVQVAPQAAVLAVPVCASNACAQRVGILGRIAARRQARAQTQVSVSVAATCTGPACGTRALGLRPFGIRGF